MDTKSFGMRAKSFDSPPKSFRTGKKSPKLRTKSFEATKEPSEGAKLTSEAARIRPNGGPLRRGQVEFMRNGEDATGLEPCQILPDGCLFQPGVPVARYWGVRPARALSATHPAMLSLPCMGHFLPCQASGSGDFLFWFECSRNCHRRTRSLRPVVIAKSAFGMNVFRLGGCVKAKLNRAFYVRRHSQPALPAVLDRACLG